jgi:xanthine/uracil permease
MFRLVTDVGYFMTGLLVAGSAVSIAAATHGHGIVAKLFAVVVTPSVLYIGYEIMSYGIREDKNAA